MWSDEEEERRAVATNPDASDEELLPADLPPPFRLAEDGSRPRPQGTPAGILRRTYRIERWAQWDDELDAFVHEFRSTFGVFPNVLQASDVTFRRIDMAAKKENIATIDGEPAHDGHTPLSDFAGTGYELMFVQGPSELEDGTVVLFFDADPDGGGEVPDEDTEVDASAASVGGHRLRIGRAMI